MSSWFQARPPDADTAQMRMIVSITALSLGIALPAYFMMHGSSDPSAQGKSAAAQALSQADQFQYTTNLRTAETSMQACYSASESFVGCTVDAPDVTITAMTQTSYSLNSHGYVSSYSAEAQTTCHASPQAPTACDAW
jgi:hypothetical protein